MAQVVAEMEKGAQQRALSQYLTFVLGEEEYGIDILGVQEIKGYTSVTTLPNTPPYVRGLMNLRGTVIPIIDLRIRFGLPEQQYTKFTVVIVVKACTKAVGLVVDAVSDVLDIPGADIRETPDYCGRSDASFITGIATIGEKLVVILDVPALLFGDELPETA